MRSSCASLADHDDVEDEDVNSEAGGRRGDRSSRNQSPSSRSASLHRPAKCRSRERGPMATDDIAVRHSRCASAVDPVLLDSGDAGDVDATLNTAVTTTTSKKTERTSRSSSTRRDGSRKSSFSSKNLVI